jgi:hypothetical protein
MSTQMLSLLEDNVAEWLRRMFGAVNVWKPRSNTYQDRLECLKILWSLVHKISVGFARIGSNPVVGKFYRQLFLSSN